MNVGSSLHSEYSLNAVSSEGLVKIPLVHGAPQVRVDIEGERSTVIDTGSSVSLIKPGVTNSPLRPTNRWPVSVAGDNLLIQGEQSKSFGINDCTFRHVSLVCKLSTNADGIVVMDLLDQFSAKLDFRNSLQPSS
jgi:hypothetical protein